MPPMYNYKNGQMSELARKTNIRQYLMNTDVLNCEFCIETDNNDCVMTIELYSN